MDTKVAKELLIYMPSKILEGILGIVIVGYYTRELSTSQYGSYVLITTTMMTLFLPFFGFLMHSGTRYCLNSIKENKENIFNSIIWSLWLVLHLVLIVLIGIASIFLKDYRNILTFVVLLIIPYSMKEILSTQMSVRKNISLVLILTTLNTSLKLILAFIFFKFMDKFYAVVLAYFISDFSTAVFSFVKSKINKNLSGFYIDKALTKEFLNYGVPLIGMALTSAITNFSDRFIIEGYYGKSALALYQGNYSISSAGFSFLMIGIMRAVNPNILRAWEDDDENIYQKVWRGLRIFLISALPCTFGLSELSKEISLIVLDNEYVVASNAIIWVSIGMCILGISEYIIKPLELNKDTNTIFRSSLIAAISNIILNFIFVPKFGYIVASITTLASYGVYLGLLLYKVKKKYDIIIEKNSIFRILTSCAVMTIAVHFSKYYINILFSILLGMLVYFIVLALTGEIKEEIEFIKEKFNKGR